jgi:hypothetical protein
MITFVDIMSIDKKDLPEAAKNLSDKDIPQLVEWLSLKDDNIRYQAFLLLQQRSMIKNDVYPFWDTFSEKLKSDNSYQRSIGLMLIAENVKWDTENLMEKTIEEYLKLLGDEKPITVRQCIQSLGKIVQYRPSLNAQIAESLISLNLMAIKGTMRKSILLDIINVLLLIRKDLKDDNIESYIFEALSGEILDKKTKKQIEVQL